MRMLDLFAGRLGWSKAFLARGWKVTAIDLIEPPVIPEGIRFIQADIMHISLRNWFEADFICASPPCEEFSVYGMKHFHPNPKFPAMGIKLFNQTRGICEESGVPYVIENVRAAQQFVGKAMHHCGPFYLWGTGVPPILPQGIRKGFDTAGVLSARGATRDEIREYCKAKGLAGAFNSQSKERKAISAQNATIPPELANCVAAYAERICEGAKV